MARIKLQLPDRFVFETIINVRIGDINYGNHLSNEMYLSYMHEARVRFFLHLGLSEMDLGGAAVIMGDCAIVFKGECRYGDPLKIEIAVHDFGTRSFDLSYRFIRTTDLKVVCESKTGMVCFDYNLGKSVAIPQLFITKCAELK